MSSLLLESRRTSRRFVVRLPISSVTLLFRSFLSSFVALLLKLYLKLVLRRPSLAFGACWSSSPILSSSSPASCLRVFLSVLRRCSWSLASRLSSSSPVERSFIDLKLRPPSLCFLRLRPFMLRQPSCHVSCPFLEASFFCRRFLKLRPLLLELRFLVISVAWPCSWAFVLVSWGSVCLGLGFRPSLRRYLLEILLQNGPFITCLSLKVLSHAYNICFILYLITCIADCGCYLSLVHPCRTY